MLVMVWASAAEPVEELSGQPSRGSLEAGHCAAISSRRRLKPTRSRPLAGRLNDMGSALRPGEMDESADLSASESLIWQ